MNFKPAFRFFTLLCLFISFASYGFIFTVSEKQLNSILNLSFPIEQTYQQVTVRFFDPVVKLDALDKKVTISASIHATQNAQTLLAMGTIEGTLEFDSFNQTLEFEKPTLKDFKVLENNMAQADEAIRHIKQTIGRNLPVIILVDFNELNIGLGDITPKDIDITPKGLMITL
jgi:hypothetical protein